MPSPTPLRIAGLLAVAPLVGSLGLLGCAGGSPLLHPARTLPRGEVRGQLGSSAQFAGGALADAVATAHERAVGLGPEPPPPGADPAYAEGALVAAAVAPGMAPFVAARVGVGASFEGGLGYTGRAMRVDFRGALALGREVDLSIGVGGAAPFYGNDPGSASLPGVDLSKLRGYGADLPILLGWQESAGAYKAWLGARVGYEHVSLENVSSDPRPGIPAQGIPLVADRFWAGGVVGFSVGFRHVHVGLELQAAYASIDGRFNQTPATVSGVVLTPATALGWDF